LGQEDKFRKKEERIEFREKVDCPKRPLSKTNAGTAHKKSGGKVLAGKRLPQEKGGLKGTAGNRTRIDLDATYGKRRVCVIRQ